jgi:hypothetical protein
MATSKKTRTTAVERKRLAQAALCHIHEIKLLLVTFLGLIHKYQRIHSTPDEYEWNGRFVPTGEEELVCSLGNLRNALTALVEDSFDEAHPVYQTRKLYRGRFLGYALQLLEELNITIDYYMDKHGIILYEFITGTIRTPGKKTPITISRDELISLSLPLEVFCVISAENYNRPFQQWARSNVKWKVQLMLFDIVPVLWDLTWDEQLERFGLGSHVQPEKYEQRGLPEPPLPGGDARTATTREQSSPVVQHPPVVLGKITDKPRVRGKAMPRLTQARHNVIEALLGVWPDGLVKDELEARSGHPDAVNIFKTIRTISPDWYAVLLPPGQEGRGSGYRIAPS